MSADTMLSKILFPESITDFENRFNNKYYDRTVWFIEDYVSHNRLDFCSRYLHLGTYEEVYDDIIEYFSTLVDPVRGLQYYDSIDGMRYLCRKVVNKSQGQIIARVIDNSEPRIIAIKQERMSKYENSRFGNNK